MTDKDPLSYGNASCLLFAARYAFDRNTGAALAVVNAILESWDRLDPGLQKQIKREASDASYNHDDWARVIDKE